MLMLLFQEATFRLCCIVQDVFLAEVSWLQNAPLNRLGVGVEVGMEGRSHGLGFLSGAHC
jgi:hypothetical protein